LEEKGIEPELVKYVDETPTVDQLRSVVEKLGIAAHDLIRTNEKVYKQQYRDQDLSDEEWLEVMVQHPKLIQRPILINGNKAMVGRPPEKVLDII
jgi:arsenate reductase